MELTESGLVNMEKHNLSTYRCSNVQTLLRFCLSVLVLMTATVSQAATFYVDVNSSNPLPPYDSPSTAAITIQDAIDVASAGDIILVEPGTYDTGSTLNTPGQWDVNSISNRVYINKAVIVRAISEDPADTIIKGAPDEESDNGCGDSSIRGVELVAGAQLIGFTVMDGYTRTNTYGGGRGGGALLGNNAIVSNCVFIGNGAYVGGGVYGGSVYNCIIQENSSLNSGAGVYGSAVYNSHILKNTSLLHGGGGYGGSYFNCVIEENVTTQTGGGLRSATLAEDCQILRNKAGTIGAGLHSVTTARRCLIADNEATGGNHAGGSQGSNLNGWIIRGNKANSHGGINAGTAVNCLIYNNQSNAGGGGVQAANLTNCTVFNNDGKSGSGVAGTSTLKNTIIWGNLPYNFSGAQTITLDYCCYEDDGKGTLTVNDSITDAPLFVDILLEDFRLQASSPCIDAGDNLNWTVADVDLDGNPRISPLNGTIDIGAYEFLRAVLTGTMYRVF
ncbi:MAG: hypothetical protein GX811_04230 [Lentisphaerae bacterium]|nr:hypothetical protein [Lentisphaerota bacterium]